MQVVLSIIIFCGLMITKYTGYDTHVTNLCIIKFIAITLSTDQSGFDVRMSAY